MAVPATPILFDVYYVPENYTCYCDITAGDATHTGFKVDRYETDHWSEISVITTTEITVTESSLGGGEGDLLKPHRVYAFNGDGDSGYLEWELSDVPATPTAFDVQFDEGLEETVCDVTAGDSTHTGFKIYREDGTWTLIKTVNTTSLSLSDEPLGGDEASLAKAHRVYAFNANGDSSALDWERQETATPTNLQFTRDGLEVTVTWDGTLESGDSWKVKLIDPGGYSDTITTVTENTETLLTGRWIDRDVRVYPTLTPANEAQITITKSIPTHTAVTDLSSQIVSSDGETDSYSVAFSCDWLQESLDDPMLNYPNGFDEPVVRVFYSLDGNDGNQIEGLGSIGGGDFEILFDLSTLPEGQAYLVTVEVESVEDTSPRPTHVLTTILGALLLTVSLVYEGQYNYTPTGDYISHTDNITLEWTQEEGVLEAEFESKIDDSEWVPLLTRTAGSSSNEEFIHTDHIYPPSSSTYLDSADYLGDNSLDHTHFYKYSDGFTGDELSDIVIDDWYPYRNLKTHTIQVRGRAVGDTEWITTETVESPLRSVWYLPEGNTYVVGEKTFTYGRWYSAYYTYFYSTGDQYNVDPYPEVMLPEVGDINEGWSNLSLVVPYVGGKTLQKVFTIDRGIIEPDLTDLRSGPQTWVASASSSFSGSYTAEKAIDSDSDSQWYSAKTYGRYGKPLSDPEWWQCDLGEALSVIGFEYKGNLQKENILVYGSSTGVFSGEETLITPSESFFYAENTGYLAYIFSEGETFQYFRLVVTGTDFDQSYTSVLSTVYGAEINDIQFYIGDNILDTDWIDIETQDWSLHWLSAVPREKLDGQSHIIQFKTIIRNADTSVWTTAETAEMTVTLPRQEEIALPTTHLNISRVA
jgi:hypothetical protein